MPAPSHMYKSNQKTSINRSNTLQNLISSHAPNKNNAQISLNTPISYDTYKRPIPPFTSTTPSQPYIIPTPTTPSNPPTPSPALLNRAHKLKNTTVSVAAK